MKILARDGHGTVKRQYTAMPKYQTTSNQSIIVVATPKVFGSHQITLLGYE